MSMGPVAVRSQYGNLFGPQALPVLEEIFFSEMQMEAPVREQLLRVVTSDRDIYQATEIHDVDLFRQMQEGEEYTYKRSLQGSPKTFTHLKWGLGVSISEEMIEDGKFDLAADMVRKLAKSARVTQEINGLNLYNNAFGSTLTADGVSLCNLAHPLPSGLTYRNRLTVDADLSPTMLDQMITDFKTQFIGDTGIVYDGLKESILLVHPSKIRYAMEILNSDLRADTTDNNLNSLKSAGLKVVTSPYLTDEDATFMLSSPSVHGGRIVSRKALGTANKAEFDTDTIKYKASYRESLGFTVGYGVFGSQGA